MTKRHIIISCIAIAALVTAFAIISRCSREESQEEAPQFRLNDTLTNAMSDIPELAPMDKKIRNFMTRWHIKGASLAVTRNDSLLYAKGNQRRELSICQGLKMHTIYDKSTYQECAEYVKKIYFFPNFGFPYQCYIIPNLNTGFRLYWIYDVKLCK
jgi:hypothetical protein